MTTAAPPEVDVAAQLAALRVDVAQMKQAVDTLVSDKRFQEPEWLTPLQIHDRTGKSTSRIRLALQVGELHGHQEEFRKRWAVHIEAEKAWLAGLSPAAQEARCPCPPCQPTSRSKGGRR